MPGIITMPDMYTPAELTEAINKLPLMPQRLRPLFTQRSVRTTKVALDIKHGRLVLEIGRASCRERVSSPV